MYVGMKRGVMLAEAERERQRWRHWSCRGSTDHEPVHLLATPFWVLVIQWLTGPIRLRHGALAFRRRVVHW